MIAFFILLVATLVAAKQSAYDDKCGCRYAYCESQVLDTAQCCEYYRENSECEGVSKHTCEATCAGLKFEGGNQKGEDVCSVTICSEPLNWVNLEKGGCTREPSKNDKCCDQKTCEFAETKVGGSYDDKCGCRYAYCESQVLDTAQCCEYYRENSECDGVSKHTCEATCAGLKFEGGNRKGQDVCSTTICEDPLNWVNVDTGGCTREPSKKDKCCDQKTCEFAEAQVSYYEQDPEYCYDSCMFDLNTHDDCIVECEIELEEADEAVAMAYTVEKTPVAVNILAAFGFCVTVFGAFRHYTTK